MTHRSLYLLVTALMLPLSLTASYDEPVFIPDNLLREGKSAFDISPSTTSSEAAPLFPWSPRRGPAFKLPGIDMAPRRADLNIQLSGVKLPMNATLSRRSTATSTHAISNSQEHMTPTLPKRAAAFKQRKRKLPRNAGIMDRLRHEALLQKDKLLDQALALNKAMHHQLIPHRNPRNENTELASIRKRRTANSPVAIQLSVDPASSARLVSSFLFYIMSLAQATGSTLRFLAPLVAARRGFNYLEEIGMDWYRGRYLRTTYHQVHNEYHNTYQIPAFLRSAGRLAAQVAMLFALGHLMEYKVVGLDQSHCYPSSLVAGGVAQQCSWLCCICWMITTMGLGHAGGTAMSVWGGPLRLQTESKRPVARQIFTRPWKLLNWARDPDRWLREIASQRKESLKPFHPNRLLFPATWQPLYFLQLLAVASAMTGEVKLRHALMRYLLLQQALGDEWFRMLMVEKRVALGIALVVGYIVATFNIFRCITSVSSLGTCLIFPYLVSVIVSAWMNVSIYFERRKRDRHEESTVLTLDQQFGALAM